jgi:adenine phosphoribosyltransferase
MGDLLGIDRKDQIITGIKNAYENLRENITNCEQIKKCYLSYPDYPKTGVLFKAFYSLFNGNNMNMNRLANVLESKYAACEIDVILPLESRGLVLGAVLADRLKCSMVPLQKPGKIPGALITMAYEKEYGADDIQISLDLCGSLFSSVVDKKKTKVYRFLVVDDLIASGGTVEAAVKIVRKLSELYAFKYEVFILALDEVIALRQAASKRIGNNYCILFRDAVNKKDFQSSIEEFGRMRRYGDWDRSRLRKMLKELAKQKGGAARRFGDALHALKDELHPNFPTKPHDLASPFFDGFRSYRMRVDDLANRERGSALPNLDKRKYAYILAAHDDDAVIYCDDDNDVDAFDEACAKCGGRAITLWRFDQAQ